ncbi:MAG: DUF4494 domain-containing protein [Flavobacteriia bacterium]|nr:DUF4494 domain-containing protein [Flavobacteriia bacterium]
MSNWFIVKVKYTKQLENGTFKKVNEPYLVASMSFTDAEARIYEELGSLIRGEFIVNSISRADFHDIFYFEDCDKWYKCKIAVSPENSKHELSKENQKKVNQSFLVAGNTVKQALENLESFLSDTMLDFHEIAIQETPIIEVYPYNETSEKKSKKEIEDFKEIESTSAVYSASGSDLDEENEDEETSSIDIEDEYDQ